MLDYTLSKALHIVGFISWFAGLFYIVRLFVYHAEAGQRPEPEREILHPQLELMARRLWQIITVPAMILTLLAGISMVVHLARLGPIPGWLHLKFALLAGLIGYTLWCGAIRRRQADKRSTWTSARLRLFNEIGTMFMVAIVFLAVFKSAMSIAWGVGGLLVLGISLMLGIRGYKKLRERS